MDFKTLNNAQLQVSLKLAVADVRRRTADGIALLAEVKARGLHLRAGYPSLFQFCVGELRFSKGMAWRWSKAVEALGQDASVVERLRDGRLSLSTAATLASHPDMLKNADGMTQEQAQTLVQELKPQKPKADILPPLLSRAVALWQDVPETPPAESTSFPAPPQRVNRLHADLSDATLAKAHRLKELLPDKSFDEILAEAFDLALKKRDPMRRHAERAAKKPRKLKAPKVAKSKRHSTIPLADRDKRIAHAGGQCEFRCARTGKRCTAKASCEIDHIQPLGLGGTDSIENTRLLCSAHHRMMTRESFSWRPHVVSRGTNQPRALHL